MSWQDYSMLEASQLSVRTFLGFFFFSSHLCRHKHLFYLCWPWTNVPNLEMTESEPLASRCSTLRHFNLPSATSEFLYFHQAFLVGDKTVVGHIDPRVLESSGLNLYFDNGERFFFKVVGFIWTRCELLKSMQINFSVTIQIMPGCFLRISTWNIFCHNTLFIF